MSAAIDNAFNNLWAEILGIGTWPEPPDAIPLALLGLPALPASHEAVQSAVRARARAVHPDVAEPSPDDPRVQDLVWARDVLIRKVRDVAKAEAVTDKKVDNVHVFSRDTRVCVVCHGERINRFEGKPYSLVRNTFGLRKHWLGYCVACARDAELERQREKRRQARADRTCETCGTTFTPSRSDGRYCSDACRQRAHRRRRAAA